MSYHDAATRDYGEAVKLASDKNQKVIPANNQILQIDIDSEEDFKVYEANAQLLLQEISDKPVKITVSASGYPHRHIIVELKRPTDIWERIALQAILGSHLTREMFNAYRVIKGIECPIVFFEGKSESPEAVRSVELED